MRGYFYIASKQCNINELHINMITKISNDGLYETSDLCLVTTLLYMGFPIENVFNNSNFYNALE